MAMRTRGSTGTPLEIKLHSSRAVRVGDLVFVSGTTAMKDGGAGPTRHPLAAGLGGPPRSARTRCLTRLPELCECTSVVLTSR
jgi:hypothetical protein